MIALILASFLSCQDMSVLPGSGPLNDGGGGGQCVGSGGAGACPEMPSVGWLYEFNAENIDTSNGALVASWVSTGTNSSAADLPTDPTYQPTYERGVINGKHVVAFDGVADAREIQGSNIAGSFFHTSYVFDVIAVIRPDRTTYGAWLMSTGTSAEKGVLFDYSNGTFCFLVLKGTAGTPAVNSCPFTSHPVGQWVTLEARGNGATFTATKNWTVTGTASFAPPVASGVATNRLTIGAGPNNQIYPFDGAIAYIGIVNRELNSTERAAIRAHLECKYGPM